MVRFYTNDDFLYTFQAKQDQPKPLQQPKSNSVAAAFNPDEEVRDGIFLLIANVFNKFIQLYYRLQISICHLYLN